MAQRALTTGQAARLLGVDSLSVRRWIQQGRIQGAYRTPGGHWRVPRRSIEQAGSGEDRELGPGRALLFVRVAREEDQHLADAALVHLTQQAKAMGCKIVEIVREVGPGMNGRSRPELEWVRKLVRDGQVEVVLVERRDRLMLLGSDEFVRWAGESGVAVQEVGLSGPEAQQAYASEFLEDVFYPMADALALAIGNQGRAEQAVARALADMADFLEWER